MFAEHISEDFSEDRRYGFYWFSSISGYLRNLRGRLLSSEKFSEVFTLWVSRGGSKEFATQTLRVHLLPRDLTYGCRSSQNYYRQSCYFENVCPRNFRYRYRLEIRMYFSNYQDTFDRDKGQKSAISGHRLHWRLSTGFFAFSPGSLCHLVRRAP